MINKHFILKDNSIEKLLSLGFKRATFTDDDCKYYKYRFPVHKHNGRMILECELMINCKSWEVFVDIYDNNKELYVPYYNREYGNYKPLLKSINKEIMKEFKRIGIEEKTIEEK